MGIGDDVDFPQSVVIRPKINAPTAIHPRHPPSQPLPHPAKTQPSSSCIIISFAISHAYLFSLLSSLDNRTVLSRLSSLLSCDWEAVDGRASGL